MNWKRSLLAGCLATLAAFGSARGQALIQFNLIPVPNPSPYPADWQTSPSLGTFYLIEPEPCTGDIQAVLSSPAGQWSTAPLHRSFPATATLPTPELAAWRTLALSGKA